MVATTPVGICMPNSLDGDIFFLAALSFVCLLFVGVLLKSFRMGLPPFFGMIHGLMAAPQGIFSHMPLVLRYILGERQATYCIF